MCVVIVLYFKSFNLCAKHSLRLYGFPAFRSSTVSCFDLISWPCARAVRAEGRACAWDDTAPPYGLLIKKTCFHTSILPYRQVHTHRQTPHWHGNLVWPLFRVSVSRAHCLSGRANGFNTAGARHGASAATQPQQRSQAMLPPLLYSSRASSRLTSTRAD